MAAAVARQRHTVLARYVVEQQEAIGSNRSKVATHRLVLQHQTIHTGSHIRHVGGLYNGSQSSYSQTPKYFLQFDGVSYSQSLQLDSKVCRTVMYHRAAYTSCSSAVVQYHKAADSSSGSVGSDKHNVVRHWLSSAYLLLFGPESFFSSQSAIQKHKPVIYRIIIQPF